MPNRRGEGLRNPEPKPSHPGCRLCGITGRNHACRRGGCGRTRGFSPANLSEFQWLFMGGVRIARRSSIDCRILLQGLDFAFHHTITGEDLMFKNILAFSLATILVLGCGGGGGGGPTIERNAFVVGELPLQTPVHGRNAPIIDFDGSLRVGAGVAPELSQLETTGARGEVSVSSGHVRDGAVGVLLSNS